jgi:hypothetical protein
VVGRFDPWWHCIFASVLSDFRILLQEDKSLNNATFLASIVAVVVTVFVIYARIMQNGLRRYLAISFRSWVEEEKKINPGITRQTILEAIVYEQRLLGSITKAEADYVLRTVRYEPTQRDINSSI